MPTRNRATTAICLPPDLMDLVRAVAYHRACAQGYRPSVSKLLAELIEARKEELKAELAPERRQKCQ